MVIAFITVLLLQTLNKSIILSHVQVTVVGKETTKEKKKIQWSVFYVYTQKYEVYMYLCVCVFVCVFACLCMYSINQVPESVYFSLQEDFQPMTYGFKMASDVTDIRAMGMVKEVEEDFNRTIKVQQSSHSISLCI